MISIKMFISKNYIQIFWSRTEIFEDATFDADILFQPIYI
jgi:hypothetical protein